MSKLAVVTGILLLTSSQVLAQAPQAAPSPNGATVASAPAKHKKPRLICQDNVNVGSRLASSQTCMTAEAWQQQKQGAKDDVNAIQRAAGEMSCPPTVRTC
jgi:hypothetical protein